MNTNALDHWKPYKPSDAMPWNLRRVVHLHRRAAFAAPWHTLQKDLEDGPSQSLDRLLSAGAKSRSDELNSLSATIALAAISSDNPQRLKAWWVFRMLKTHDPLGERLALMWHDHFATSNRKVNNLKLMFEQNQIFRLHGRKNFLALLTSVIKHPAMLIWLDGDTNRKGNSNENLARELLELFTLGVGNFTEKDVKESARALTGWTVVNDRFEYRKARHDDSVLEVLGRKGRCDGDQLLSHLVGEPEAARRIAWRLCNTFMGESFFVKESVDAQIDELAQGLADNQLDIGWAVETILKSEKFFADDNIQSRVVGPVEFVIGAVRCLELQENAPSTMILSNWLARMGQELFYPPNVGGWKGGRSWLNSRTIVARSNFASGLTMGTIWHPEKPVELDKLFSKHGVADEPEEKVRWLTQLFWGTEPENVLKHATGFFRANANERAQENTLAMLLSGVEHQLG